jgi:hypothetical protein
MVFVVHTPFILHAVLVCVFLFFSFQFCDLAEVAIIHIKNQLFFQKKKNQENCCEICFATNSINHLNSGDQLIHTMNSLLETF